MDLTFGVFVPQGWKMELSTIPDPVAKWQKAVEVAELAEALGYDSLWVYDHFHNVPVPAHETMFECWTTLAALSQRTERIKLGQMVGLLALPEPRSAGQDHVQHRRHLRRAPHLGRSARAGTSTSSPGTATSSCPPPTASGSCGRPSRSSRRCGASPTSATRAATSPSTAPSATPSRCSRPDPRSSSAEGGEQLTLRVVARLADASNFGGKPHEFTHKCEVLQQHCTEVGRDYDEIQKTWSPEVFIREDEQEIIDGGTRSFFGEAFDSWRAGNLVGTPEQVAEKVQAYVDLGCTGFYPWCSDYPETESMRLLAEQVIPEVRRANA